MSLTADGGGFQITVPRRSFVHQQLNVSSFFIRDFQNSMTLTRETRNDAQQALKRIDFETKVEKLKVGEYLVKHYSFTNETGYTLRLYAASQNSYFYLSITSPKQTGTQIENVLGSLLIGGQRVFPSYVPSEKPSGAAVEFDSLQSSQQVQDALSIPGPSPTSAIFKDIQKPDLTLNNPTVTHDLLVLVQPRADFLRYTRQTQMMGVRPRGGEVRAKVEFLANGRIGKVIIDPDLDKTMLEAVAEAICAIKFIPAENAGTPITVTRIITYFVHFSD